MEVLNPDAAMDKREEAAISSLADFLTHDKIHEAIFDAKKFDFDFVLDLNQAVAKKFVDSEREVYNNVANGSPLVVPFP